MDLILIIVILIVLFRWRLLGYSRSITAPAVSASWASFLSCCCY